MDPDISFIPTIEKAFKKDNVIVIHDAQGGQPIRKWYQDWMPSNGVKLQVSKAPFKGAFLFF